MTGRCRPVPSTWPSTCWAHPRRGSRTGCRGWTWPRIPTPPRPSTRSPPVTAPLRGSACWSTAPPRPSGCSRRRCGRGSRRASTRRSPLRRPPCAAPACPWSGCSRDPADGFVLDPRSVPERADLVVLGRPDNPTGRTEDLDVLAALTRPGRVVVVDEAFADFWPDASGVYAAGLPGVVCVRSLTKLWGLAGLRVGYLLADPALARRLDEVRQPWPVNALAVHATTWLCPAEDERRERADSLAAARQGLLDELAPLPLEVWPSPANYLLVRSGLTDLRTRLLDRGVAVRTGRDVPGAGQHVRPDRGASGPGGAGGPACRPPGRTGGRPGAGRPAGRRHEHPHRQLASPRRADAGARWGQVRQVTARPAVAGRLCRGALRRAGPGPGRQRLRLGRPGGRHTGATGRSGWTTLETDDVPAALETATQPVLVDCLATWLAGVMGDGGRLGVGGRRQRMAASRSTPRSTRLLKAWQSASVPVVAVSNEVGSGVVPGTRSGVLFRDALGRLNRQVADLTDDVRLVVAGRVQRLEEERA